MSDKKVKEIRREVHLKGNLKNNEIKKFWRIKESQVSWTENFKLKN